MFFSNVQFDFFLLSDKARAQLGTKKYRSRCNLGTSKKRRFCDDSDEEKDSGEDGDGAELVSGEKTFKPLFNVWQWEDPKSLDIMISVVFVLPSGVQKLRGVR